MDNMTRWRDGLLSDAEMLSWLLYEQAGLITTMTVVHTQIQEVHAAMAVAETKVAEERIKKLVGSLGQ